MIAQYLLFSICDFLCETRLHRRRIKIWYFQIIANGMITIKNTYL